MNVAIILAGGEGKRMNHPIPKQYLKLNRKPIIFYILKTYSEIKEVNKILVVSHKERFGFLKKLCKTNHFPLKKIYFLEKDKTRQLSSFKALKFCKEEFKCKDKDVVIFQDGVRPFVKKEIIKKCIREARKCGAAVAIVPSTETFASVDEKGNLKKTFPPGSLHFGKSPEVFQWKIIFTAHCKALRNKIEDYRNNFGLVLYNKYPVKTVEGDYSDIKITTPFDIKIALKILKDNAQNANKRTQSKKT